MPKRIQRKRTKGWRMPANAVSVTRPGPWGNPFRVGDPIDEDDPDGEKFESVEDVLEAYECWVCFGGPLPHTVEELRGKDLACYCRLDQPCHADLLLQWANE